MNSADTIQFIASNQPSMHHRMTDITEKSRCAFLVVHSIISDPILLIQQIITIPGTVQRVRYKVMNKGELTVASLCLVSYMLLKEKFPKWKDYWMREGFSENIKGETGWTEEYLQCPAGHLFRWPGQRISQPVSATAQLQAPSRSGRRWAATSKCPSTCTSVRSSWSVLDYLLSAMFPEILYMAVMNFGET